MVVVGVFVVEFPDVLWPQLLGIGSIDVPGTYLDDEVPAGTQEFRVAPGAAYAIGIAFESALVVTDGIVGVDQRWSYEMSDVTLDEPVPPAWLQSYMTPLCISEFERIDRNGDVDCIVEVDVYIDCDIDITGGPADDISRY